MQVEQHNLNSPTRMVVAQEDLHLQCFTRWQVGCFEETFSEFPQRCSERRLVCLNEEVGVLHPCICIGCSGVTLEEYIFVLSVPGSAIVHDMLRPMSQPW